MGAEVVVLVAAADVSGLVKKSPPLMIGAVAADAALPTVPPTPPLNHAFNWSLSVNKEVRFDVLVLLFWLLLSFVVSSFRGSMVPTNNKQ